MLCNALVMHSRKSRALLGTATPMHPRRSRAPLGTATPVHPSGSRAPLGTATPRIRRKAELPSTPRVTFILGGAKPFLGTMIALVLRQGIILSALGRTR